MNTTTDFNARSQVTFETCDCFRNNYYDFKKNYLNSFPAILVLNF